MHKMHAGRGGQHHVPCSLSNSSKGPQQEGSKGWPTILPHWEHELNEKFTEGMHPLMGDWDFEALGNSPEDTILSSQKQISWVCSKCQHRWTASPADRSGKNPSGWPVCAGRAAL